MENKKELLSITEDQLKSTIDEAVTKAKDEFTKAQSPFSGNFIIKNQEEEKPAVVGAYVKTILHSQKSGMGLKASAEYLLDKSKTVAMDIVHKGMNESTAADGGVLVIPEVSNEFIELLTAQSFMRQLPTQKITMSGAQLEINRETNGAGAYWAGENPGVITENNHQLAKYTLTPKKLISWSTISNDLINDTGAKAEMIVQNAIIKAAATTEEAAFIAGTGSSNQPKGLYYWTAAGNIETTGGSTTELIETDLFTLESNLRGNNVMGELVWMMPWAIYSSWRTKLRATTNVIAWPELRESTPMLLGHKVIINQNVASDKVYLFAPEEFIIADRIGLGFRVNPPHNDANFAYGIDETLIVAESRVDCVLKHDVSCSVLEGL